MARMRNGGRKIYRTMQGKQVDMDLLRKKNELTPAVGNAKVNARGDQLGPGGQIIRKREDIIKDYYKENPTAVADQDAVGSVSQAEKKEYQAPEMQKTTKSRSTTRAQSKVKEEGEWIEDENGNFVPKDSN